MGGSPQSALAQLGLTESRAREFLLAEIKSPARDRVGAIVLAGTRAFLKLPQSTRGVAATGLFAWAKAYVNSAVFRAAYDSHRRSVIPERTRETLSVEDQIKNLQAKQRASIEQTRKMAASLPPADAARVLEQIKQIEKDLDDPARQNVLRDALERERAERSANEDASRARDEVALPGDPRTLFARRLREFLADTADANFSARTIALTGGPDGIEFVMPADREKPWTWQAAVIVGREATTAARAAAEAWLKELER